MFDLIAAKPDCTPLALADFLGQMSVVSGFSQALENSGVFPARYLNALSDADFYCRLRNYVLYDSLLDNWMMFVVNNLARVVMAMSTAFVTLWVIMAGLKMMSGTQREPVIELMFRGGKIVLVLSLISSMLAATDTIVHTVLGLQNAITTLITGSDLSVDRLIDMNLAIAQVMNMVVEDVTLTSLDQANQSGSKSLLGGLLGQTGPAALTSVLVLLSQIAIVFALMLAPLFLFFLLFKETSSLFWSWAKFLLGTFISLCFLAIVSSVAMSASLSYGITVMVSYVLNSVADAGDALNATPLQIGLGAVAEVLIGLLTSGGDRVDMSGATMRMAMMGGLFATLIVAVPPMIMQMFNASIGYASNLMGSMGLIRPTAQSGGGGGGAAAGQQGAQAAGGGGAGSYSPAALSGPAGGSAQSNNQMLINRANSQHLGGADGGGAGLGAPRPGAVGLAPLSNNNVAQIRGLQSGDEFRAGSQVLSKSAPVDGGSSATTTTGSTGWSPKYANGTDVEDAVFVKQAHLGTGGALHVDGRGDNAASIGGSRVIEQGAGRAEVVRPNIAAPEMAVALAQSKATPVHAMPRGLVGAAAPAQLSPARLSTSVPTKTA